MVSLNSEPAGGAAVQPWRVHVASGCSSTHGSAVSRLLRPDACKSQSHVDLPVTLADGVPVLASLNVDQNGRFLELDLWKTDFTPVIRIPDDLSTGDLGIE